MASVITQDGKQSHPLVSQGDASPTVMFFSTGASPRRAVKEWLPAAQQLVGRGCDPVFVVDGRCTEDWLAKGSEVGARFRILHDDGAGFWRVPYRQYSRRWWKLSHLLQRLASRTPLANWGVAWLELSKRLELATQLLDLERPKAIVVYSDSFRFEFAAAVKVAGRQSIPTMVCPLASTVPAKAALEHRRESPQFAAKYSLQPLWNKLAGRMFRSWVHDFYGVEMFFYPFQVNAVAGLLGILPPHPCGVAGGLATRVAAPSERDRRVLLEEGVSPEKMVVTGSPDFDELCRYLCQGPALRREICNSLGIDANRKILLFNVIHRAEGGLWPWEVLWREVEFLLQTFASLRNVHVIMSLHPGARPDDYAPVARKYGATLSLDHGIVELAAACDIYVSELSTTLHLSIGAHKPTIVPYFYEHIYRSASYDRSVAAAYRDSGVVLVKERDDLLPLLRRLVEDEPFYASLVNAQRQVASQWVLLDGNCTTRIVEEIIAMIEGNCLSKR